MSTYSSAVLALTPFTYWRMDATSGTTETDLGSLAHDLTYSGGFTLNQPGLIASDPTSASVAFNGSSGIASATATTLMGSGSAWGMVAWYSTTNASQFGTFDNINGVALGVSNTSVSGPGNHIFITALGVSGGDSGLTIVADGQPHQIAFTYNAGAFSVVQDGVPASGSGAFAQNGTDGISVGAIPTVYFDGNIGDVAYIPSLTVTQVQSLYTIATAPAGITGTGAAVQSGQTVSSAGKETMSGTAGAVQSAQTANGVAKEAMSGSGGGVQSAQTASGAGKETISGSGIGAQAAQTVSSTARETIFGTATAAQGAQTVNASGSAGAAPVTGTGTAAQSAQTAAAAGKETIAGSAAAVQAAQTVAASGTSVPPPITGTGAAVQGTQFVAAGGYTNVTGIVAAVQRAQTASVVGIVVGSSGETVHLYLPIATSESLTLPIETTLPLRLPIATAVIIPQPLG